MANLIIKSSADNLVLQGSGGNSAITVAAAGTTTFAQNATLSGTANNLGTVTAGTIASGVHGVYTLEELDHFIYQTKTTSTTASQDQINISGSNYLTITPSATTDKVDFGVRINVRMGANAQQYMGIAIQRATATDFSGTAPNVWATGRHSWGSGAMPSDFYNILGGSIMQTAGQWGMSAGTTYYFRMVGQTHSTNPSNGFDWGYQGAGVVGSGVEFNYKRWSVI